MRTSLLFSLFVLFAFGGRAQTVHAGDQTIDRVKLGGLFLTLPVEVRTVGAEWQKTLRSYGRLTLSRGVYRVTNADIRAVSPEPINLVSQLKGTRGGTTLFVSFDLGSGNFVRPGQTGYAEAEALLKEFAAQTQFANEVRSAEGSLGEAQKTHQKLVQSGERLLRDLERNKRDKERLQRSLEENAKELEQLTKAIETNQAAQTNALTEMDAQKKNVEAVRAKKPGQN